MLTTVEAEIDVDGNVRLLEPLKIEKKSRAIVTILDDEAPKTNGESEQPKRRIRELFGSASLGYATGADNEKIDADLAREYMNTHEDQD